MVYISKVYTRSGDTGETSLADGSRQPKDGPRVTAYGDVDELNATIGLVRTELDRVDAANQMFVDALDGELARVQQELFNLGAELSTPGSSADPGKRVVIEDRHVERLEQEIDAHNERLEPLRSFVLPGGGPVAATLHLARTVCRRAERSVVTLARHETPRPETIRYLNRLSDYLFVASRASTRVLGHDEVLWDPKSV